MHGDSDLLVLRCARETKIVVVVVFWHARFVAWIKRSVCLCCCSFSVCNAKRHDSDDEWRHSTRMNSMIYDCQLFGCAQIPIYFAAAVLAFSGMSLRFLALFLLILRDCNALFVCLSHWQLTISCENSKKNERRCLCENIHAKAINHHRLGQTQTQTHHSRIPFPFRPFAMLRTSGLTRSKYRCAN